MALVPYTTPGTIFARTSKHLDHHMTCEHVYMLGGTAETPQSFHG